MADINRSNARQRFRALAITYRGHRVVYLHEQARFRHRHGRLYTAPKNLPRSCWGRAVPVVFKTCKQAVQWATSESGMVVAEGRCFVAYI